MRRRGRGGGGASRVGKKGANWAVLLWISVTEDIGLSTWYCGFRVVSPEVHGSSRPQRPFTTFDNTSQVESTSIPLSSSGSTELWPRRCQLDAERAVEAHSVQTHREPRNVPLMLVRALGEQRATTLPIVGNVLCGETFGCNSLWTRRKIAPGTTRPACKYPFKELERTRYLGFHEL